MKCRIIAALYSDGRWRHDIFRGDEYIGLRMLDKDNNDIFRAKNDEYAIYSNADGTHIEYEWTEGAL